MTWLSVVLIGLGLGDLVRARDRPWASWAGAAVAAGSILAVGGLSGLAAVADWLALVVAAAVSVGWIVLSDRTQSTGRGALGALGVFGGLALLLVACSGWSSEPDGAIGSWLQWADLPARVPSTDRVLLLAGLALFNIATGNVIVRLVLLAIGALRPDHVVAANNAPPQPSDRLKGGRLLGPMERLVILGLGLAGEFGAASLVIAAKGLLRFPEIQAAGRGSRGLGAQSGARSGPPGIDDVTEYFLVGSFVSWLIAFVSLGLAA